MNEREGGMGGGPRLRRMLAGLLVVLTSLGAVATVVAVWVHAQALNSDRWADLAGRLIREPRVVEAVSTRISTAIVNGLDVETRIETALAGAERLPDQVELLAGPATSALQQQLEARIDRMLSTPQAQELWVDANRNAHQAIVRILRGETRPGVTVQNGEVTLDAIPLINRGLASTQTLLSDLFGRPIELPTAEELQASGTIDQARQLLEDRLGLALPEDFGEIEVFDSDRLAVAQDAVRLLDILQALVIGVTLFLLGASLVVSTTRRRTLVQLAVGVLVGALIARLAIQEIEDSIVDLAARGSRDAVGEVVDDVFAGLVDFTTVLVIAGIAVAVAAYLAGRPAWLRRLGTQVSAGRVSVASRAGTWARAHADGIRFAGVVGAILTLHVVDLSWASVSAVLVLLGLYELGVSYLQGWRLRDQRIEQAPDV